MSNTGYTIDGTDLINIFKLKTSGTNIKTGYIISKGLDLADIFQPLDGISNQAKITIIQFSKW
jgi:hypothetical protein